MTNGEIWRTVPSVPDVLVSSEGRVMLAPYRGPMPKGGERSYGGTPTFGVWNKQDARFVIVVRGTTYKVARLVAEAFHGSAPFDRAVVMHLDENAANNRADNLAWGTQRENLNAPGFLEYCRGRTGDRHPVAAGQASEGTVMIDLNDDTASCSWTHLLEAATENAVTDFEIEFCESLREKLARFGESARLTDAQFHKLTCIAQAGGFWERDQ